MDFMFILQILGKTISFRILIKQGTVLSELEILKTNNIKHTDLH